MFIKVQVKLAKLILLRVGPFSLNPFRKYFQKIKLLLEVKRMFLFRFKSFIKSFFKNSFLGSKLQPLSSRSICWSLLGSPNCRDRGEPRNDCTYTCMHDLPLPCRPCPTRAPSPPPKLATHSKKPKASKQTQIWFSFIFFMKSPRGQ